MQRRAFLTTAAAAAAATTIAPAGADPLPLGNLPDTRYPDPRVEAIDKRFKYGASLPWRHCTTGCRGVTAPLFFA